MTEVKIPEVVNAVPAVRPSAALARPDYVEKSQEGLEGLTKDDVQMPRLAIAQKMSPQLSKRDPAYIEGLEEGHMFNSLTGENYGFGPLKFCILRIEPVRAVEFHPQGSGLTGVKDPDVPLTDPRTQWTQDGDKRVKPIATTFRDYIVLLNNEEPIALSFKSTGIKVAKTLNGLIKFRNAPVYMGQYEIRTVLAKSPLGEYYLPKVGNAGWVPENMKEHVMNMSRGFRDVVVVVHRENDADPDEPGDASETPTKADGTPF